jgi:hypothetical protein
VNTVTRGSVSQQVFSVVKGFTDDSSLTQNKDDCQSESDEFPEETEFEDCLALGSKLINCGTQEWIVKLVNLTRKNASYSTKSKSKQMKSELNLSNITGTRSIGITNTFTRYDVADLTEFVAYDGADGRFRGRLRGHDFVSDGQATIMSEWERNERVKIEINLSNNSVAFYKPFNSVVPSFVISDLPKVSNGWRLCGVLYQKNIGLEIESSRTRMISDFNFRYMINKVNNYALNFKEHAPLLAHKVDRLSHSSLAALSRSITREVAQFQVFSRKYQAYERELRKMQKLVEDRMRPNPNNYKNWSAKDISAYIVSLNPDAFEKYRDGLYVKLSQASVTGARLAEVTKEALQSYGVEALADRLFIIDHLKNIVNKC